MVASNDIASGVFFLCAGVIMAGLSLQLPLGSANAMGSGDLPLLISGVLALIGLVLTLRGLRARGSGPLLRVDLASIPLRGIAVGILASVVFTVTVVLFGLAPALFCGVFVASLASPQNSLRSAAVVAAPITLLCVLIFGIALQVPVPMLKFGS